MPKHATRIEPLTAASRLVLVGRVGAAHGIKGEVRLLSFTAEPTAIGTYGPLYESNGVRQFEIASVRPLKDNVLIARLAGVASREAAEALNNVELYLPRAILPTPKDDEFYHADLIGLAAIREDGAALGRVVDVLNFGGGDILEIAPSCDGETWLLPFTKASVPTIDFAGGKIIVVPPIEVEAPPDEAQINASR